MADTLPALHNNVLSTLPEGAEVIVSISDGAGGRTFAACIPSAIGTPGGTGGAGGTGGGFTPTPNSIPLADLIVPSGTANGTVMTWNGTELVFAAVTATGAAPTPDGVTLQANGSNVWSVIAADPSTFAPATPWSDTTGIVVRQGADDLEGTAIQLYQYVLDKGVGIADLPAPVAGVITIDGASATLAGVPAKGARIFVGALSADTAFAAPTNLPPDAYEILLTTNGHTPTFNFGIWKGTTGGVAPASWSASAEDVVTMVWTGSRAVLGQAKGS